MGRRNRRLNDMSYLLAFDIETIPDTETGRKLLDLEGLDDADVAQAMFHLRNQQKGSDFLQHQLHRIAAISIALRTPDEFKLLSLGEESSTEKELVDLFFKGVQKYSPILVSWNGSGFDFPVLHYRALKYGITARRYWETGDGDTSFRWNNYFNRYHWRHVDLMDVLSGYERGARAPLEHIALMLGLPGKMGMHGSKVWGAYKAGEIGKIRAYCETDTLNTYLIYQRFELMRGNLTAQSYARECEQVRQYLESSDRPHLQKYLQKWSHDSPGD